MISATSPKSSKFATLIHLSAVWRLWRRLFNRQPLANGKSGNTQTQTLTEAAPTSKKKAVAAAPVIHWAEWRIDLMERLWGKGFLLPGGTDFVHDLTKPLSLGSKASVLVLGAGMGGPSNLIAEEFGAFIDGVEPDPELAAAGTKRAAVVKGLSRVTIKNIGIDDGAAFTRKYDAIFCQEILLKRVDKTQFLDHCVKALKDNGKIVITDFSSADDIEAGANDSWLKRENAAGPTLDENELRELFKNAGFRIRTVEDMTDRYVGLILDGWVALEESLRANAANRDILLGMIEEAERWTERVTLLKKDQIRYTRIFATKQTQF